jgi:hypothetical protein
LDIPPALVVVDGSGEIKALSTLATMEDHVPRSAVLENAHANIEARSRLLERRSPRSIEELLGIEGSIANEYFRAWSGVELKWKALKRRPIPDEWLRGTIRRSAFFTAARVSAAHIPRLRLITWSQCGRSLIAQSWP